jgi:aminoglycoside phosphotransferase (APT) family kinase protein
VPTWSPQLVVDEPLARRLVDRFPETAGKPLRLLATGWDRTAWLVDERWVFGFPRRDVVLPGIERELAWLPRLAPLLPVPIPAPRFVGEPALEFPWPFFGGEFIAGDEAGNVELDDDARDAIGVELAAFLRVLHSIDGGGLPADGNGRADMRDRVPKTRETLAQLEALNLWRAPTVVQQLLEAAESLPMPPDSQTVAHGDLHFRQVLVANGRLSGVIDWIDICRGDPAIDLLMLWSFVPPVGRAAFLAEYGFVSDDQLLRARVLSLNVNSFLAHFAYVEGLPAVEREAIAGLERTVRD